MLDYYLQYNNMEVVSVPMYLCRHTEFACEPTQIWLLGKTDFGELMLKLCTIQSNVMSMTLNHQLDTSWQQVQHQHLKASCFAAVSPDYRAAYLLRL